MQAECGSGADTVQPMRLRLIRNATLELEVRRPVAAARSDARPGRRAPAVGDTPNDRRNPLVELPEPAEAIAERAEVVLVTHLHADHMDETAVRLLGGDRPVVCQPPDESRAARARVLGRAAGGGVARARRAAGVTHLRAARHRGDRRGDGAGVRLRAERGGRADRLRRRRHDLVRRRARRDRRARARRRWSSTRAARASTRATRSS